MKLYHLVSREMKVDIASMERVLNYYGIKFIRIEDEAEWYVYTTEGKAEKISELYGVEFISMTENKA